MVKQQTPRPSDERYPHGIETPFTELVIEHKFHTEDKIGGFLRVVKQECFERGGFRTLRLTEWKELDIGIERIERMQDEIGSAKTGTRTLCIDEIDAATRHDILNEAGVAADHDAASDVTQQQKSIDDIKRLSQA